jgi:hypothetical protein
MSDLAAFSNAMAAKVLMRTYDRSYPEVEQAADETRPAAPSIYEGFRCRARIYDSGTVEAGFAKGWALVGPTKSEDAIKAGKMVFAEIDSTGLQAGLDLCVVPTGKWLSFGEGEYLAAPKLRGPIGLRLDLSFSLNEALKQVKAGRLRGGYRVLFGTLNHLFVSADWSAVSAVLRAVLENDFPIVVSAGTLRFASSASTSISNWKSLISAAKARARTEGHDPEVMFRGL